MCTNKCGLCTRASVYPSPPPTAYETRSGYSATSKCLDAGGALFGCGGSPEVLLTCCETQHDPKVTPGGTDRSRKNDADCPNGWPKILILEPNSAPQHVWSPWSQFGPRGAGDSNPGPLGTKSRVLDHSAPRGHSPERSAPRGIIPLGDHPLGNHPPGESPTWGIVPLGNRPPGLRTRQPCAALCGPWARKVFDSKVFR